MSSGGGGVAKTPTAAEQSAGNIQTAQAQARLSNVNQNTPWGSLTYTEGPNNRWTSDTTLSPELQQQFSGLQNIITGSMGNVSTDPTANVQGFDPRNYNFDDTVNQARDAAYAQQTQFLDPEFAKSQAALDQNLADRGIPLGSQAYTGMQDDLSRQKQAAYADARNSAFNQGLSAQSQGFTQGMQGRQQQIAENQLPLSTLTQVMQLQQGAQGTGGGLGSSVSQPQVQGIDWNSIGQGEQAKAAASAQQSAQTNQMIGTGATVAASIAAAAIIA